MTTNIPYPSVRPQPSGSQEVKVKEGPYGVPDVMQCGLHSSRESTSAVHPLEHSEKHWNENKCQMDFAMLRKMEGIHMPLRLQMENNISQKMCRLPGMVSSNVMRDTLTGRDEMINFEDVLNNPFEAEEVGNIHMLMEKRQGLL